MSLDLINFAESASAGKVCNKKIDFDCNGRIESWETANEMPRIIFGGFSMLLSASSMYIVFANHWYSKVQFMFANWFSAAGTLNLIFSGLTSIPMFFLWLVSYSEKLEILDAFYVFANVQTWYLATLFWLWWIFFLIHVVVRNGGVVLSPDTEDDHSMTIMIVQFVIGLTGIIMQTVMADRFNFWYVKKQFLGGRTVNEAKNKVWGYPASLGSTARSWYNYSDQNRDARRPEPVEVEREKKETTRRAVDDTFSMDW